MKYKFCPQCGAPLKFIKLKEEDHKELVCSKCSFIFYQNSKPTASAIILNNKQEIMLTKRAVEPFKNQWDFPGGFLLADENPEKGVARELLEETGLRILPKRIIGIYIDKYVRLKNGKKKEDEYTLNIYYLCEIISGKAKPQSDISKIKFFPLNKTPRVAFKNGREALIEFKKIVLNKGLIF